MSREPKKFLIRIPQRLRRIAGKALLLLAGIALTCAALETYLRLKWPFLNGEYLSHFHPKAGNICQPNAQMRWTNPHSEFFVVEKINSLGFLDREPLNPEQRETGCHIAFIGDSFVEAREVAIADKFHVQLEEMAAKELPDLNITTSAFGHGGTGQINQLPFYDEFARHLEPCVLALVFVFNDFANNHPILNSLQRREAWDPEHPPFATARKNADGAFDLLLPDRYFRERMLPRLPMSWTSRVKIRVKVYLPQKPYLAKWLYSKRLLWYARREAAKESLRGDPQITAWVNFLSQRPRYASLAEEWPPVARANVHSVFEREELPPVFKEALEFTAYALDQFKARADQDGVSLIILSTHTMGARGTLPFDRMNALANERNIPVIDQTDYIRRRHGGRIADAHWKHDRHWNTTGHQWAAEALLEYLKENPHIRRRPYVRSHQNLAQSLQHRHSDTRLRISNGRESLDCCTQSNKGEQVNTLEPQTIIKPTQGR